MAYGFTYTLPTISGSHSNFPVLLKTADFPADALNGVGQFLNGGGNLRAYTDDTKATRLPVEVVRCITGGSPAAEVWVKIPTAATGNTIYLEADAVETTQPAFTNLYGRNAVWSDYALVLHLNDHTSIVDSTGNHSPTLSGTLSSDPGPTGSGVAFTGSQYITVPDSAALDAATGAGQARTLELLAYDTQNDNKVICEKGTNKHFVFQNYGGDTFLFRTNTAGTDTENAKTPTLANDVWHSFACTHDSGTNTIHYNGNTAADTGTDTAASDDTSNLVIGSRSGSFGFVGSLAECRIRADAVSADWAATTDGNIRASSAWGTVGTWADTGGGGGQSFTGTVNHSTNIAALFRETRKLTGNTPHAVTPSASFSAGLSFAGDVTLTTSVSAAIKTAQKFTGDVTHTQGVNGAFTTAFYFAGDVSLPQTPTAQFKTAQHLAGNVPIAQTPGAQFGNAQSFFGAIVHPINIDAVYQLTRRLTGDTTHTITPGAASKLIQKLAGVTPQAVSISGQFDLATGQTFTGGVNFAAANDAQFSNVYRITGDQMHAMTPVGLFNSTLTLDIPGVDLDFMYRELDVNFVLQERDLTF